MSTRPPASTTVSAGAIARRAGTPPPPPPKSPARARSRSRSMSRRRGDGRVMTLTMPSPLGALAPATPTTAESVNGSAAHHPPKLQLQPQAEPQFQAQPLSPLRLQSKKRLKRESSMSRIGSRLRPSKSFRKSGAPSASTGPGRGQRRSIASLARRESTKLRSILKPSQPVDAKSSVASRRGPTWQPPATVERRQSGTKLRSILKPTPDLVAPIAVKPPAPIAKDNPNQPPVILIKPVSKTGTQGAGPSQHTGEDSRARLQNIKDSAAPAPATKQTSAQSLSKGRNGKDILSEIDFEHISGTEARRLIRQHNREYFHSRIWDPALQKDFAGAYRLANERDELSGPPNERQNQQKTQPHASERGSLQTLVEPTPPAKATTSEKDGWRRYEAMGDDEWGRSVRLAMAKLENQITTEATTDPVKFMKARRESAQLRAWIASQRRTSEARLSALATGTARPGSPFEEAFVAELLRENEIMLKHSSNPLAEAGKLFQDPGSKRSTLLPHYTPFSQYPLLTPLEEIEAEARQQQMSTEDKPRRRLSVFDEKKAARRAGREYKSLSTSTQLDQLDEHGAQCCGFWKPKAFVNKIPQ